jgi:hypothetical protein
VLSDLHAQRNNGHITQGKRFYKHRLSGLPAGRLGGSGT